MKSLFRPRSTRPQTPAHEHAQQPDSDDGVTTVSVPSLLALHHDAESIALKPGRIRAGNSGTYLSPFKGRGMEFDEVRPYMQGDDVRMLDWRVTARTGRAHTKLFREERERAVLLWIDLRQPMFFATRGAFKSVRAAQAAALLGWSAVQQGDRLGALLFSEQQHTELRPKRGKPPLLHLLKKIAELASPTANDQQGHSDTINQALLRLRAVAQPGSLIALCSDFSGMDAQSEAHLAQLARHNELMLIDIHDPLEAELPPAGKYRVSDGRAFLTIATADAAWRVRYQQNFEQQRERLRQLCRQHRMTLVPMTTAEAPQKALQRSLGARR
jgi:uncharacterized protein (DUF58 family)